MPRRLERNEFLGRWRITEMEMWDQDYLDMEVKAFILFEGNGIGQFQFGLVRGCIDYRPSERHGKPAVEWSWESSDECDPAMGRGWAVLETPEMLAGRIFFHQGDDSSFKAKRMSPPRRAQPRPRHRVISIIRDKPRR
ncbi:MAG TPA: hypothetical protein PKY77_10820 [Phycisphaerae bacterium]|nr:hypothetical protein [Phycisphaerae bacterium]HRY70072.1 hypothetical protein [Phycisphaerae bacterium]HSA27348.1 hypothetical protein [Phycisphaerae bacterium]